LHILYAYFVDLLLIHEKNDFAGI